MQQPEANAELQSWIVRQALTGVAPQVVLDELRGQGWEEQAAIDLVEGAVRNHLDEHASDNGLPPPCRVPAPIDANGSAVLRVIDRDVQVIASLLQPRVIVFGGLLSEDECDAMVELSRPKMHRSATLNLETGTDEIHEHRTSHGTSFHRGENALCTRIEARIAALLDWPLENGEGLQVLRYGIGAEYKPHYDYFDPGRPGVGATLRRGGQRVASLVMYLNTPARGGATVFPDAHFEAAPVKGNAVFFSYDRPHPMTKSLHGGAPVHEGEKWVATKWLREGRHA